MSGKASRDRGKRGEREWALKLTVNGFPARRGVQYQGGPNSPDVVCDCLPSIHFECKRTERLSLYDALAQAERDAGVGKTPVLWHRRDHFPGVVVMYENDWLDLIRASDWVKGDKDGN